MSNLASNDPKINPSISTTNKHTYFISHISYPCSQTVRSAQVSMLRQYHFFHSTTLTTLSFGRVDTKCPRKIRSPSASAIQQTYKSCTVMARCRGALGIIGKARKESKNNARNFRVDMCGCSSALQVVNCWHSYDVSKQNFFDPTDF